MKHISYTDLRQNLATVMDQASADRDPILVTRQGAESVVILSQREFDGLMETVHLFSSPANAKRLMQAMQDADEGRLISHELID